MADKKRPPTSGTRKGNGAGWGGPAKGKGIWGAASGMGWGGESRGSVAPQARRMTSEERTSLRREMIDLYLAIARDPTNPALIRMQAARHLIERIDNPFSDL